MKLSKRMEEVLEDLKNAEYYYQLKNPESIHDRISDLYYEDRMDSHLRPAHILEGGYLGILGHTNTLKALERRGLLEIIELGGDELDIVKLFDHEIEKPPLKEALKVKYRRSYYSSYVGKQITQELTTHAVSEKGIEYLKNSVESNDTEFTLLETEVVELKLWDGAMKKSPK